MTSFGRGRGWSMLKKEQPLRRPGDTTYSNTVKDVIDKVVTYDTREYISPQLIQEIIDLLIDAVNKDNLKYYRFSFGFSETTVLSFFNTKLQISGIHAIIFGSKLYFMSHLLQK